MTGLLQHLDAFVVLSHSVEDIQLFGITILLHHDPVLSDCLTVASSLTLQLVPFAEKFTERGVGASFRRPFFSFAMLHPRVKTPSEHHANLLFGQRFPDISLEETKLLLSNTLQRPTYQSKLGWGQILAIFDSDPAQSMEHRFTNPEEDMQNKLQQAWIEEVDTDFPALVVVATIVTPRPSITYGRTGSDYLQCLCRHILTIY